MPESTDKVRRLAELRQSKGLQFLIEVDGGVGLDNAAVLIEAGANVLVAGSSVFKAEQPEKVIAQLKAV